MDADDVDTSAVADLLDTALDRQVIPRHREVIDQLGEAGAAVFYDGLAARYADSETPEQQAVVAHACGAKGWRCTPLAGSKMRSGLTT
jgi:hypothetical protein